MRAAKRNVNKKRANGQPATARKDWTVGRNGSSNSSKAFDEVVSAVYQTLVHHRLGDDLEWTARVIVSKLAHGYGLAPSRGAESIAGASKATRRVAGNKKERSL